MQQQQVVVPNAKALIKPLYTTAAGRAFKDYKA